MRYVTCAVVFCCCLLGFSCARNPTGASSNRPAGIELHVLIAPAAKSAAVAETRWDSLIVKVSAADMTTQYFRFALTAGTRLFTDTLAGIAAGQNRTVELWTKSAADSVVHRAPAQTVDLAAGEFKALSFSLQPQCGSIYVVLQDVPTAVDSVFFRFVSDNAAVIRTAAVARSAKIYISLDYIPDNTAGTVYITARSALGDTVYRSQNHLTYSVSQSATIPASFASAPGSLGINATIVPPGVTVVSGQMASGDTVGAEYGPLVISEIMYMANDSEYIELYNPTGADTSFDTLIVQIDTTRRIFTNVTVKSRDYYVIGRRALPWAGTFHTVASALDLSSTSGNWITLRTKTMRVIDWVAFAVKSNDLGWPNIASAKASIALDSLPANPAYNNYGVHWKTAVSRVDTTAVPVTLQQGTPGRAGI